MVKAEVKKVVKDREGGWGWERERNGGWGWEREKWGVGEGERERTRNRNYLTRNVV